MLEIIEKIPMSYKNTANKIDQLQRFKGIIHLQRLADVIKRYISLRSRSIRTESGFSGLRYFRMSTKSIYTAEKWSCKSVQRTVERLMLIMISARRCGLCAKKCPVEAIIGEKKQAHYIVQDRCIDAVCVSIHANLKRSPYL